MPVQTFPAPSPPQTPIPAQITAHPPNPPKSQFRQCQSRHPPPPHPKLPSPRKSQPIHQIPPNHSSDNASPDTRPHPTPNSHPRANHSPSAKSPQITVQTMPVQTPAPSPPQTPVPAQITAHPPNPINHSSDTGPSFRLTNISSQVYNCSAYLTHPCQCDPPEPRPSDWRKRFHDWNSPPSEIHLHAGLLPVDPSAGGCQAGPRRSTGTSTNWDAARTSRHTTWWRNWPLTRAVYWPASRRHTHTNTNTNTRPPGHPPTRRQ